MRADQIVSSILRADDQFLVEIGRLTSLFGEIEDCLARDAFELLELGSDNGLKKPAMEKLAELRIIEKRDLLKRVIADVGRFYDVDYQGAVKVLDELGNINRLRRTVIHGRVRWSTSDEKPVFVDSRGEVLPAWLTDLADLNLKILNWQRNYYSELTTLMQAVLRAYDEFADRLLRHPKLPAECQVRLRGFKQPKANLA